MPSEYSLRLRLELQAIGENTNTWGAVLNTQLGSLLEQAIAGVASVAMSDVDTTLTALDGAVDQSRNAAIILTGALTAPRAAIVPAAQKLWVVRNETTGGQPVTVRTALGTGVAIPPGYIGRVYCDGTNVHLSAPLYAPGSNTVSANVAGNISGNVTGTAANVTGVVAIANGGTGAVTPPLARAALGASGVGDAVFVAADAAAAQAAIGGGATGRAVFSAGAQAAARAAMEAAWATDVIQCGINMGTGVLLGRTSAGYGAIEGVVVGAGLLLAGGALSVRERQIMLLRDERSAGVAGGTSTGGTWNTRTLNSARYSTIPGASLGSNRVTLPAGTYAVQGWAVADRPYLHRLRLLNETDSLVVSVGGSHYDRVPYGDSGDVGVAHIDDVITLGGTKALLLQHYVEDGRGTTGFGRAVNFNGWQEVYASLRIERLG